ncbi:MAG: DUF1566 domain-containing protein [Phycisphaerae bacterium]|nr:DUF1566 domain-containing protein [Phycisphaerae bacterium]
MAVETEVLVDNGDGTITDTKAGLMWQKSDAGPMRWEQAVEACKNLSLAGHSDWRLPDIKELKELFKGLHSDDHVVERRLAPFEWTGDRYWSSKVVDPYHAAFLHNFNGGSQPWEPKNKPYYVRGVRALSKE